MPKLNFQLATWANQVLIAALVTGCLFHPFASCLGLLIFLSSQASDRYFTRNVTDRDRLELQQTKSEVQQIKLEVQKLKEASDKASIGKAFGGK